MKFDLSYEQRLFLKGEKVYLKRIDRDMIDQMVKALDDMSCETKVLTTTGKVFNRSSIERYLNAVVEASDRIDFGIFTVKEDQWVGDVVLNDYDPNSGICNLRVAIDKKTNFGKGYGQEAMFLAMNYGFGMMGVRRMELEVLADNPRAIHVYEKLGFVKEGLRREACYFNYKYHNMVTMACLKRDFLRQFPEVEEGYEWG